MPNINFNYNAIVKILGALVILVGIAMIPALGSAAYYNETDNFNAILISTSGSLIIGGVMFFFTKPIKAYFRPREGYLVVALCWVVASFFGTFPYYLSDYTHSFVDSFFESVAGFTTTGCTSIGAEIMPHSLLMWKATSHWIGGMGILIFVISFLPALGISGQTIAKAEAPGPSFEKMAVRISDSAKILYLLYFSFSILEFILLNASSSMGAFDALINTMGSISTAGLFSHPGGIGYYDSLYVEIIIMTFTFLGSINFVLFYYLAKGQWREFFRNVELRVFLRIILGSIIMCTLALYYIGHYPSMAKALRDSAFQVVGFITTSGYSNADYTVWPTFCQVLLLTLLFIGGCGASTSGSVKVSRILVILKLVGRGFYKRMHPRSVVAVKVGGKAVPAPIVSAIAVFVLMYMGLFLLSCLLLSLEGMDMETTVSSAVSILSNAGMGFGEVGAAGNYSLYSAPLKLYLSFVMIVGRLELFTVIILFTKSFWGKDR